jgi:hypothetical protein
MLTLTIQGLRLVSSTNAREHWAVKAKRVKHQRGTVALLLRSKALVTGAALDSFHHVVCVVRIAPRPLDGHDNLRESAKACVDGIADWLGVKDNDPRVSWEYGQERGKVREYAVRVEILAVDRVAKEERERCAEWDRVLG